MNYYVDSDFKTLLQNDVEAVIELIKKAYNQTKVFYNGKAVDDFLYFDTTKTFTHGYCFYFANLLKSVFDNAKLVVADENYKTISHIYALIDGYAYDVKGKKPLKKYYVLTVSDIDFIRENHSQIDPEVYNTFENFFYDNLRKYEELNKPIIEMKKSA